MRGIWWKSLAVCILLYVILAGFLVPLKPGVQEIEPRRIHAGDSVVLRIEGYNTYFNREVASRHIWLKLNDAFALQGSDITVQDDAHLNVTFRIPHLFPLKGNVHPMALIISDAEHGSFVLPDAVFVSDCAFTASPDASWEATSEMEIAHARDFRFPYRSILYETIRNVYFHVPMWFGMIILFFGSAWCSIRFVRKGNPDDDLKALALDSLGAGPSAA